jgi:hypothetical protein
MSIDDITTMKMGDYRMDLLDFDGKLYGLELLNDDQAHHASKYLLKIKKMQSPDDFGVFSCAVKNEYGNAEFMFEVKRKREQLSLNSDF